MLRLGLLFVLLGGCRTDKSAPLLFDTGLGADQDGDGYPASEDCDDSSATINPDAAEICDGLDNNCDGQIDEGVTTTAYADEDSDGFGDAAASVETCAIPSSYVSDSSDCDDRNDTVYPTADELCDELDNNCNGEVDEGLWATWYGDSDGDGYGTEDTVLAACAPPSGFVRQSGDCDDDQPAANPGETEVCDDIDNDCDGDTDEGVTFTYYLDGDSDGYGVSDVTIEACALPSGYSNRPGDCDDGRRDISPDGVEVCDDVDNDCDGDTDEDDASDASTWYDDSDSDGYGSSSSVAACKQPPGYVSNSDDCDDSQPAANPGETEVCDDIDNDCDGNTDEDDAADAPTWYVDGDSDGYGGSASVVSCDRPAGYVGTGGDCDDGDPAASPGESEVCDEIDNDCDGETDEGVLTTWYLDSDGDGYGDASMEACTEPSSDYVTQGGDCDDEDTDINPGEPEGCDGGDDNCDGFIDNDFDEDGFSDESCGGTDCDDEDSNVYPDSSGVCALGEDCLDIITEGRASADGTYTIDPDGIDNGADPFSVTCDMTTDGGGWTGVVDDDFSSDPCPSGWTGTSFGTCYRGFSSSGLSASQVFDAYGITYDEVYGSLSLYQYASPDGFHGPGDVTSTTSIEGIYTDGVSITHGTSGSRSHIFSYAIGLTTGGYSSNDCPADGGLSPSSVVGSDYLCDTANSFRYSWVYSFYRTPLFTGDIWQVSLSSSTTDDIEVRLMMDQRTSDEEAYLATLELWIR